MNDPRRAVYLQQLSQQQSLSSSSSSSPAGVIQRVTKRSILATSITGGGDPERAVVAYYRFERDHLCVVADDKKTKDGMKCALLLDVGTSFPPPIVDT